MHGPNLPGIPEKRAPRRNERQWWKNAVVYRVDIEKFCDSDGSGAVHNLAAGRAGAKLELGTDVKGVEDLLEARDHTLTRKGVLDVELGPYGYLWLKLQR